MEIRNEGSTPLRVMFPSAPVTWAAVKNTVRLSQPGLSATQPVFTDVMFDTSTVLEIPGTSEGITTATIKISLRPAQLEAADEVATATLLFELSGHPCESDAFLSKTFEVGLRFQTYQAPLTVIAVPQQIDVSQH